MNDYKQIMATIQFHEAVSARNKLGDDHHRLDRYYTADYFKIHPQWADKIIKYFRDLRTQGTKVVHADICGRTEASSLGADKSYCFSLKTSEFRKALTPEGQVFCDGDIFDTDDFSRFINKIKQEKPALITFEPVAGLQDYGPCQKITDAPSYKQITYQRLIKRLCSIIEITRPSGFIYLEKPFQLDADDIIYALRGKSQKEWPISLALKKTAEKMGCTIEIKSEIGGPYFLLRKGLDGDL